jgi:hypothetical protein
MTVTDKRADIADPAHAGGDAALGDGHLHGPGRGLGRHRHARRRLLGLGVAYNIDVIVPGDRAGCCTSASCREAST